MRTRLTVKSAPGRANLNHPLTECQDKPYADAVQHQHGVEDWNLIDEDAELLGHQRTVGRRRAFADRKQAPRLFNQAHVISPVTGENLSRNQKGLVKTVGSNQPNRAVNAVFFA